MDCQHPTTAPTSNSHKDAGLHRFCLTCNTFFDSDGSPATAEPMAVRNSLADRLDAAAARFGTDLSGLSHVIRNGGTLG